MTPADGRRDLASSMAAAVQWLTDVATVRDGLPPGPHGRRMPVTSWNGALRGEYRVATREWNCLCPVWHTGQAVKALVLAAQALERPAWLDAARANAAFLLANRLTAGPDRGLILAFEDHPDMVNTSAILEALDGLFHLSDATGDESYRQAALEALAWVRDHAWDPEAGNFRDLYEVAARKFRYNIRASQGRPLLDDAVFLKGWRLTGDESYREIAVRTAETLLRDEDPPGNWIGYIPCNRERGSLHPRQAYWWGLPLLAVFEATGEARFRDGFLRALEWYRRALRRDGGFIRGTYTDFNTDSFGHATSGAACAAIVFLAGYRHTGDRSLLAMADRALNFCHSVQFTEPADPNLKGCILEKLLPPNGSDRSPYHIRDLGTIFYLQAAAHRWCLEKPNERTGAAQ